MHHGEAIRSNQSKIERENTTYSVAVLAGVEWNRVKGKAETGIFRWVARTGGG